MSGDPLSPGALADAELLAAGYGVPDVPPGWPVLAAEALHGLAGEVVATIEPETEADPAGLLLTFLAFFGNTLGPGPHAVADGAAHPGRINVLLVGDTSRGRKNTALARVRNLFVYADPGWSDTRILSGFGSGEALIEEVADPDDGQVDKRVLVAEGEFARVLAVAGREGSILSAVIRDAWDHGDLQHRVRHRPLRARGAHVSVLSLITVEELRRRLTDVEVANGFANRFLFACVRRHQLLPEGGNLDDREVATLGAAVRQALERARKLHLVHRSPDARVLWAKLYEEMADGAPAGLLGAVTARAEAQCLRLSVLFALLDGSPLIDVDHLEAAWAVWRYCEASAAHTFGDALGDDVADRLLEAVRAEPDGLDVTAQRDLFSRHIDTARLRLARAELVRRGLAEERTEQTGGRPRLVLYPLAPKAFQASKGDLRRLERFERTVEQGTR